MSLFSGLRSMSVQEGELDISTLFLSSCGNESLPETPYTVVLSKSALHTQPTVLKQTFLFTKNWTVPVAQLPWRSVNDSGSQARPFGKNWHRLKSAKCERPPSNHRARSQEYTTLQWSPWCHWKKKYPTETSYPSCHFLVSTLLSHSLKRPKHRV